MLREPQDIYSYSALACIAIQSNQNDQHGGQSIVNFDYGMAPGVAKTYVKCYRDNLIRALELMTPIENASDEVRAMIKDIERQYGMLPKLEGCDRYEAIVRERVIAMGLDEGDADRVLKYVCKRAWAETDKRTYQAMEALIHNLNTMHSRAGAQTPFSSLNYGMDTSPEARMVIRKTYCWPPMRGLGRRRNARYSRYRYSRVKDGVNYNPGEPELRPVSSWRARSAAKRLFPNFSLPGRALQPTVLQARPIHETEIAYMGCRTRVIGNVYDPSRETIQRPRQPVALPRSTCRASAIRRQARCGRASLRSLTRSIDLVIRPACCSALKYRRASTCTTIPS